ncbi:hypothetical protein Dimus_021100 [Dionaea muscipula]
MFRESWMIDNGLSNVMDLIKRQKWEKLFKRRELIHIDAIKDFYARLTLVHYKKKDIARSSVRGVDIEFDNLRWASILGVPGNSGICEYIKEVWEDSKYTKTLEIIRKFANNSMIMEARRLKRENGVWWLGSGENRRRDDEEATPAEDAQVNEEEAEAQLDFDWEAVVDEAALQGKSGSDDQFYDAQVEVEEPVAEAPTVLVFPASPEDSSNLQKEPATVGVDPSGPTGSIPDSVMIQLQADFERA